MKLDESKTAVIVLGPPGSLAAGALGPLSLYVRSSVRSLGVYLHNALKFDRQISSVVKLFPASLHETPPTPCLVTVATVTGSAVNEEEK